MLPLSFNEVLVPDPVLGCLFSLCVFTPLMIRFMASLTMHVYVLMTFKFLSPDLFLGFHTYKHNYPNSFNGCVIYISSLTCPSPNSFFSPSKPVSLAVFWISVSSNSILLAALDKTLRPSSTPSALYLAHQQILLVLTLRDIHNESSLPLLQSLQSMPELSPVQVIAIVFSLLSLLPPLPHSSVQQS